MVLHAARRVGLIASPAQSLLTKTGISSPAVGGFPTAHIPSTNSSSTNLAATLAAQSAIDRGVKKLRVLVIGAGAVGFLAAALVRTLSDLQESAAPVATISAMDIDTAKLATLKKAGYADATYAVPVLPRPETKEEGLTRSRELANRALVELSHDAQDRAARKGYDIVFECTGVESCIQTAIYVRISFFPFSLSFWFVLRFDQDRLEFRDHSIASSPVPCFAGYSSTRRPPAGDR